MRTSNKTETLLEFLCKDENCSCTYKFLAKQLNLSSRQLYRILCSLQERGIVKIEKCLSNQRKHLVSIQEGIKMARLRKREIIAPRITIEEMSSGVKKTMNKRKRKTVDLEPIMIPNSVLQILNYWNSIEHTPNLSIPKPTDGFYHNPTKLLKKIITQLRKVLTGNFFGKHGGAPVIELGEKNRVVSIDEIKLSIDRYCTEAYSINHLPIDKFPLENKNLSEFIYFELATTLKRKSLLMHFLVNDPQLTPAAKAQKFKMEKEKLEGVKINKVKRDGLNLLIITEELKKVYHKIYGIDDEQENKDLEKVARALYDFAEAHGGADYQTRKWPWYAVESLGWKKERGGNIKAIPRTMLQDWFYSDVLTPYLKYKQIEGLVYLPELTGENTTTRDDKVMTEEEARKLFPMMFKYE